MMNPPRPLLAHEGQKKTFSKFLIPGLLLFFFSIVLCILNKTARMSKVIHDDHSSFWVSVDDISKLHEWYNELDVCLLSSPFIAGPMSTTGATDDEHSHSSTYVRHHRESRSDQRKILVDKETNWSDSCAKEFRNTGVRTRVGNRPYFCHISNCHQPLAARPFHQKELNLKLIRSPKHSFKQYLFQLAEAEHALVFIGDTVTKQVSKWASSVFFFIVYSYIIFYHVSCYIHIFVECRSIILRSDQVG